MVAKVRSGKSIRGVLHYNEHKVQSGTARLILASRFSCDIDQLSFHDKLNRFQKITMLNEKAKTNTLHISLNFDPEEKLSIVQLQNIANTYMDKIGFGEQPYLVYNHTDAGHPHIHIATINIQLDGQRIDIHNIGRNQSEQARKEIEIEFNLVKASSKSKQEQPLKPVQLQKVIYGKSETKRAITNTVNEVIRSYSFTSLAELNAVLKQFNIMADRGSEGTRMYEKKGLMYSLLDSNGNKAGVPIKASSIYGEPTIANLEKKFAQNVERRKPYKIPLRLKLDKILLGPNLTKDSFIQQLQKQNILVLFRENDQSFTYGITLIDYRSKTVFNGSDLGKAYSAKALTDRFIPTEAKQPVKEASKWAPTTQQKAVEPDLLAKEQSNLLEMLLGKADEGQQLLFPRKKKRKGRGFRR